MRVRMKCLHSLQGTALRAVASALCVVADERGGNRRTGTRFCSGRGGPGLGRGRQPYEYVGALHAYVELRRRAEVLK